MLIRDGGPLFELPIEQFIAKQLEDKEFKEVVLPADNNEEGEEEEPCEKFKTIEVPALGFNHLIYQLNN